MFDTIILLTGPAEHSVFTTLLRGHRPGLTVVPVFTAADLVAIEPEWLARARLIAFASPVTVPKAVLDQLGFGAYHFHPGPPQYPGEAPAQVALNERATNFGATVHRLTGQVATGPIVDVELFAIPAGAGTAALEELTYTRLVASFWRLAAKLATQSEPLIQRATRWGTPSHSHASRRSSRDVSSISGKEHPHQLALCRDDAGIVPSMEPIGYRRAATPEGEAANA